MRIVIQKDPDEVGKWVANHLVEKINAIGPTKDRPFVLGLPIGSSPLPTYHELIRLHSEKKISFENIITFNMDEYVGLPEDQSYRYT